MSDPHMKNKININDILNHSIEELGITLPEGETAFDFDTTFSHIVKKTAEETVGSFISDLTSITSLFIFLFNTGPSGEKYTKSESDLEFLALLPLISPFLSASSRTISLTTTNKSNGLLASLIKFIEKFNKKHPITVSSAKTSLKIGAGYGLKILNENNVLPSEISQHINDVATIHGFGAKESTKNVSENFDKKIHKDKIKFDKKNNAYNVNLSKSQYNNSRKSIDAFIKKYEKQGVTVNIKIK